MFAYDLSALTPWIIGFVALAVIGALASVAILSDFVVRNHRTRVASHQSIPAYYGRLVLAH